MWRFLGFVGRCLLPEPRHESAGCALILQVGLAFAFDGALFGQGDAGDPEEKVEDHRGGVNRDPAPGGAAGKDPEAPPDDGFKEVVWVPGIAPESNLADFALARRIGLKPLHLRVTE